VSSKQLTVQRDVVDCVTLRGFATEPAHQDEIAIEDSHVPEQNRMVIVPCSVEIFCRASSGHPQAGLIPRIQDVPGDRFAEEPRFLDEW